MASLHFPGHSSEPESKILNVKSSWSVVWYGIVEFNILECAAARHDGSGSGDNQNFKM